MTLEEAWNQSYRERVVAVNELQEISDSIQESRTGQKTLRSSDIDKRHN